MDQLKHWLEQQFEERTVEPNSSLGKAFHGFDHRVGHFRPLRIRGGVPELPFPQCVRDCYRWHRLLGWPSHDQGPFHYLLGHWLNLTRFLDVPGAPLDNNIAERALKLAIRQRKNSLFYATDYSAYIASMLTSLIATCLYAGVNALEYLVALQEHRSAVFRDPAAWLPWNYHATSPRLSPAFSNRPPFGPAADCHSRAGSATRGRRAACWRPPPEATT